MPDYVRALDRDTGTEISVFRSELDHGNYDVLDEAAVNANGDPLPARRTSDPVPEQGYAVHSVVDLKAEIDRRNAERVAEQHVPSSGNKSDLIAALDADDNPKE